MRNVKKIESILSTGLTIAFDSQLGYLTECPTNLGTGLRASVLMFLPALTESGKIGALVEEVSRLGLTVRGLYGEGSQAEGFMYQISNEVTLGVSERDILTAVEDAVMSICRAERDEMERLYVKRDLKTMDRAKKSFGVLTNAVMLSYSEFLGHIANVKLGVMLGMLNLGDVEELDKLIISVRPANISEQYGRRLSALDRDLFRAEMVEKRLIKLKE